MLHNKLIQLYSCATTSAVDQSPRYLAANIRTIAPTIDMKKPAAWKRDPAGGREKRLAMKPPTKDPAMPIKATTYQGIGWLLGTMKCAIKPTTRPTITIQIR